MHKARIVCLLLILSIIFLGLFSRHISAIPLSAGDLLWAMMIFFMIRFLFINHQAKSIALISLSICFLVEISQLYQADWINAIRQTIIGRLVLGQGFLWSDLLAYTGGVFLSFLLEITLLKNTLYLDKSNHK